MQQGKKKKLRDTYMNDCAARKFLRQHPEFDNQHIDHPAHSNEASALYNNERAASKQSEKSRIIQEALHEYPDLYVCEILTLYFLGASMAELQTILDRPTIGATKVWIHDKKEQVYEWFKNYRGRNMKNQYTVVNTIETKELLYKGKREVVYKIKSRFGPIWIDSKGKKFEDVVQEVLDATNWEVIDLNWEGGTYEDEE